MTISAAPTQIPYAGNGVTTAFPIPFPFDTAADIGVVLTDSTGTPTRLTTGFSITGGNGSTGTLTMDVAPAVNEALVVFDDPELTQPTDFGVNDAFPADTHERTLDRLERQIKRLHQRVDRTIRMQDGDTADGDDNLLPIESSRASRFLGFDANGKVTILSGTGGGDSALRDDLANGLDGPGSAIIAIARHAIEVTAGVIPANYLKEVGDSERYSTYADWAKVASLLGFGRLRDSGTFTTPIDFTADVQILVDAGEVTIAAAGAVDYMIRASGDLAIGGGRLILDGDGVCAYAGVHTTTRLPRAYGVHVLNCTHGFNCGSDHTVTNSNDVTSGSRGYLQNCLVHNAPGAAYSLRGNPTLIDSRLEVIDCETSGSLTGSMGSNVGGTQRFLYHDHVSTRGGVWDGHEDAETTSGYMCNYAEVIGGTYRNVGRGPTIGRETKRWQIIGTRSYNIQGVGVAGDVTKGSGATEVLGEIAHCITDGCEIGIRTTGNGINIHDNNVKNCFGTSGDVVIAGEASNTTLGRTSITRDDTTDFTAVNVLESSTAHVDIDTIRTNSTRKFCLRTGNNSEIIAGGEKPRTITANDDIRSTDRILRVDATAGPVDLDLPGLASDRSRISGFTCKILQLPAANGMTISFDGGQTTETINGSAAISIPANPGPRPREITLTCFDALTHTWYATGVWPGATYTITNETTDRTMDADTAADAELADVISTALQDLGFGA